ncbi:hypothetical protein BJ875DRAFT_459242 [Amylocarpus encephaloides]|uniref:Thioredoxin domain-containing protein n=1 Tax=Amylocarpus encephaloides TaxID=45428 RepID=A0A9P8C6M1_9HELO|nr:hypothetical protein BJ875DRAFT_459242 [Amylocarpus encephaloides]
MPLHVSTATPEAIATTLESSPCQKPSYLVVYASLMDGRSWCGDCRDAETFVNAKFADSPHVVTVVYAGQREEWRQTDNPWRQAPFSITALPTIVKVLDEKWEYLVEGDVYDQEKLDAFVKA